MQINLKELGLDETDERIFEMLSKDGRMKSTDMAKELNISHTAVDKRIKKLCEKKNMKISARFNLFGDLNYFEVDVFQFSRNKKNSICSRMSKLNFISQILVYDENDVKYIKTFCYGSDEEEIKLKFNSIKKDGYEFDFKIKKIDEKVKHIF